MRGLGYRCGDCFNWMKSRSCPREHNVNGQTRGPSMSGPTCSLFIKEERSMKKPEGKHEPHLIYQSMTIAVARQRAYGIEKHGSVDGWKTTTTMEHLDAARRHIDEAIEAIRIGDSYRLIDQDSGQLHYAAAICNLMFEIERMDELARGKV